MYSYYDVIKQAQFFEKQESIEITSNTLKMIWTFGIHALFLVGPNDIVVIFVFFVFESIIWYRIRNFGNEKSVVQIQVELN